MNAPVPSHGAGRIVRWLARISAGCGTVPLCLALLVCVGTRLQGALPSANPVHEPNSTTVAATDAELIDGVLAKRAPGLGWMLRGQLGIAIADEAKRAGYDPLLILAIIDVESDFDEEALSERGARGLMQIKPSTLQFLAQTQGLKLSRRELEQDPAVQVRLGIRYLRQLQDRLGDLDRALMAYNAGPARVRRNMKDRELEPYRRYTRVVRRDFRRFRENEGLGGDWALAQREVE